MNNSHDKDRISPLRSGEAASSIDEELEKVKKEIQEEYYDAYGSKLPQEEAGGEMPPKPKKKEYTLQGLKDEMFRRGRQERQDHITQISDEELEALEKKQAQKDQIQEEADQEATADRRQDQPVQSPPLKHRPAEKDQPEAPSEKKTLWDRLMGRPQDQPRESWQEDRPKDWMPLDEPQVPGLDESDLRQGQDSQGHQTITRLDQPEAKPQPRNLAPEDSKEAGQPEEKVSHKKAKPEKLGLGTGYKADRLPLGTGQPEAELLADLPDIEAKRHEMEEAIPEEKDTIRHQEVIPDKIKKKVYPEEDHEPIYSPEDDYYDFEKDD